MHEGVAEQQEAEEEEREGLHGNAEQAFFRVDVVGGCVEEALADAGNDLGHVLHVGRIERDDRHDREYGDAAGPPAGFKDHEPQDDGEIPPCVGRVVLPALLEDGEAVVREVGAEAEGQCEQRDVVPGHVRARCLAIRRHDQKQHRHHDADEQVHVLVLHQLVAERDLDQAQLEDFVDGRECREQRQDHDDVGPECTGFAIAGQFDVFGGRLCVGGHDGA